VSSLSGRLFASTLAALALTLALTIGVGAVLTRRQVDRSQAAALRQSADNLALQRRRSVSYKTQNECSGGVCQIIAPRAQFAQYVPDVNRSSDGTTTYLGQRELYSYRTLPSRGLLIVSPSSSSAAWRPFLRDLLWSAAAGVVLAALLSLVVSRSIGRPIRRVADATRGIAAAEQHEPLPETGAVELADLARAFNEMAEQLRVSRESERAFLLSVSHELKTPLTAIRGWAEGLADGAFEPAEAARTIGVESHRLERLVHDLLDLARMKRSEFSVRREPVDLLDVAREAVARHEPAASEIGVELREEGEEQWVEADHDRLLQVASNLIENALRETPPQGSVVVSVRPGVLAVADTGPGIAEADQEHAFDRFYLYDKFGRDRPVGSGLGLAIVKQLATAMGGDVRVDSPPGAGATFVVELPPLSRTQLRGVDDLEIGAVQGT
jgi:two-component system sensor histidine kinase BaeS